MLFKVLGAIVVIYLLFLPFITIECIKFGARIMLSTHDFVNKSGENSERSETFEFLKSIAMKLNEKTEEQKEKKERKENKKKRAKLAQEEQRALDILNNVDIYDGTEVGQKEIK